MLNLPIAVALQVSRNRLESKTIEHEIELISSSGASFIELRVDYDPEPAMLDIKNIISLAHKNGLQTILTCRITREGGGFTPESNFHHLKIIKHMVEAKPTMADVELSNDLEFLSDVVRLCNQAGIRLILSRHDFTSTPPLERVKKEAELIISKALNIVNIRKKDIYIKSIYMAKKIIDNAFPLELVRTINEKRFQCISFCMGERGMLSRVGCVLPKKQGNKAFRSPFTYASLSSEQGTAPGQIDMREMEILLSKFGL